MGVSLLGTMGGKGSRFAENATGGVWRDLAAVLS